LLGEGEGGERMDLSGYGGGTGRCLRGLVDQGVVGLGPMLWPCGFKRGFV